MDEAMTYFLCLFGSLSSVWSIFDAEVIIHEGKHGEKEGTKEEGKRDGVKEGVKGGVEFALVRERSP